MKEELKKEFKLISFLDKKSLARLNEIAKQGRTRYTKKHIKKPVEKEINHKKLMETPMEIKKIMEERKGVNFGGK